MSGVPTVVDDDQSPLVQECYRMHEAGFFMPLSRLKGLGYEDRSYRDLKGREEDFDTTIERVIHTVNRRNTAFRGVGPLLERFTADGTEMVRMTKDGLGWWRKYKSKSIFPHPHPDIEEGEIDVKPSERLYISMLLGQLTPEDRVLHDINLTKTAESYGCNLYIFRERVLPILEMGAIVRIVRIKDGRQVPRDTNNASYSIVATNRLFRQSEEEDPLFFPTPSQSEVEEAKVERKVTSINDPQNRTPLAKRLNERYSLEEGDDWHISGVDVHRRATPGLESENPFFEEMGIPIEHRESEDLDYVTENSQNAHHLYWVPEGCAPPPEPEDETSGVTPIYTRETKLEPLFDELLNKPPPKADPTFYVNKFLPCEQWDERFDFDGWDGDLSEFIRTKTTYDRWVNGTYTHASRLMTDAEREHWGLTPWHKKVYCQIPLKVPEGDPPYSLFRFQPLSIFRERMRGLSPWYFGHVHIPDIAEPGNQRGDFNFYAGFNIRWRFKTEWEMENMEGDGDRLYRVHACTLPLDERRRDYLIGEIEEHELGPTDPSVSLQFGDEQAREIQKEVISEILSEFEDTRDEIDEGLAYIKHRLEEFISQSIAGDVDKSD